MTMVARTADVARTRNGSASPSLPGVLALPVCLGVSLVLGAGQAMTAWRTEPAAPLAVRYARPPLTFLLGISACAGLVWASPSAAVLAAVALAVFMGWKFLSTSGAAGSDVDPYFSSWRWEQLSRWRRERSSCPSLVARPTRKSVNTRIGLRSQRLRGSVMVPARAMPWRLCP